MATPTELEDINTSGLTLIMAGKINLTNKILNLVETIYPGKIT